MLSHDYRLLI